MTYCSEAPNCENDEQAEREAQDFHGGGEGHDACPHNGGGQVEHATATKGGGQGELFGRGGSSQSKGPPQDEKAEVRKVGVVLWT